MKVIAYLKDKGIKRAIEVFWKYKIDLILQRLILIFIRNSPLKNTIIMESHNDFDSNGGAFYNFLIENRINSCFKIVWLIKNKKPKNLPPNVYCYNLFKPSIRKAYYICTARIFTADCYVTSKVRKNQKSYYLTHGGGLAIKKVDMPLPSTVDYVLLPSEEYASYSANLYHVPYPSKKLLYLGYPEQDYFYNHIKNSELKKIIGDKKYNKVIAWMPTFRRGEHGRNDSNIKQTYGIPLIKSLKDYNSLNSQLQKLGILLIIKIHPMQILDDLGIENLSNILVLTKNEMKKFNLDNYRLLADTDALISDYSSLGVEYFHMHKPIAYVIDDIDQYKFFWEQDTGELMVGDKISSLDDMKNFIISISKGEDHFALLREEKFMHTHKYHDGNSSKRLAEFMKLI